MTTADLHSRLQRLGLRAEKAAWWSKGLWLLGALLLLTGIVLLCWAGLRETFDLVALQIPPAIETALNTLNEPAVRGGPVGDVADALYSVHSKAVSSITYLIIVSVVAGLGMAVVSQRVAPAAISIAGGGILYCIVISSQAILPSNSDPGYALIKQIKDGIDARDYEAVRSAVMEKSLRIPQNQADFIWWQLAAMSHKTKGVDFGSILENLDARASELNPTPGVRYAIEMRALGVPRSVEAVAFQRDAEKVTTQRAYIGKLVTLLGVLMGVFAACVTLLAGVINRRLARIQSLQIVAR